jgi:hypothetical protein
MRTPAEILRRAIVMTSVAFRASLEVTADTRCEELSRQVLPWLEEHGMASDIDPIERELLATVFGQLDASQHTDANWSGEGANIMFWALGLLAQPQYDEPLDYTRWFDRVGILRGDPLEALSDVAPRPVSELSEFHMRIETMKTALRLARTDVSVQPALKYLSFTIVVHRSSGGLKRTSIKPQSRRLLILQHSASVLQDFAWCEAWLLPG